ncbi:MAG: winged helix-turn-helix domain-containing protein [ANME-2 cluster archaeon]|nr:winged helix-turn-helix domain-containing protein [ANME-2 cluster archaeon]
MKKNDKTIPDNITITKKLDEIHDDLKRFAEQANQLHLETVLSGSRRDLLNSIVAHIIDDIDEGLENKMVQDCHMRNTCKSKFTAFLQDNASLIKRDELRDDLVLEKQAELETMRKNAPLDTCDKCFMEVSNISDKQVRLMRSLMIYRTNNEAKEDILALPEDSIVSEILEPLSNKQRLQIMKAVVVETRTFSELSRLTGLRGGNLLFHLQKLVYGEMILQRHERGDYMITDKGFKVLTSISELYSKTMPQTDSGVLKI